MKSRIWMVALIGLMLSTSLITTACKKDYCDGNCNWNPQYQAYGGCDVVSGGNCYDECAAKKAATNKSIYLTRCNCH